MHFVLWVDRFLFAFLGSKSLLSSQEMDHVDQLTSKLSQSIVQACDSYFSQGSLRNELDEFLDTGRSNGRPLKWELMIIAPQTVFSLHAHPNVECIFVAKGAFYEYRREVSPIAL